MPSSRTFFSVTAKHAPIPTGTTPISVDVQTDPENNLKMEDKALFYLIVKDFDDVFSPTMTGYNGSMGKFEAVVHMGPVQPSQRKGRCPQYSRDKVLELQDKFDVLEHMGVFMKPEDAGISVEYVNPSLCLPSPKVGEIY